MSPSFLKIAGLLLLLTGLSACTYKYREMPAVGSNYLPMAKASYQITQEVSGAACFARLFGISYGYDDNFGVIGYYSLGKQLALYDALNKMPGATYVISPKFEEEITNAFFPFYWQVCTTVVARGVILTGSK